MFYAEPVTAGNGGGINTRQTPATSYCLAILLQLHSGFKQCRGICSALVIIGHCALSRINGVGVVAVTRLGIPIHHFYL